MDSDISVVIPLYNKEAEIETALRSVLAQTVRPAEIIVIDDGSTDAGAEKVASFRSPLVRLVRQPNAGVAAARNRGAALARGEYIAFLDGDDFWKPGYLEKIKALADACPGCGAYCTAFEIVSGSRTYPNRSPRREGIVEDFFRTAMRGYICQPSATVIPARVFRETGGFPEGMKLGEDLYLWIKIASRYPVCFSPEPLVRYSRTASNRSVSVYTPEKTAFSFEDLYRKGETDRNEYLARCALGKAVTLTVKGDTAYGRRAENFFGYTRLNRRMLVRLKILNRMPVRLRGLLNGLYDRLAWGVARKGL